MRRGSQTGHSVPGWLIWGAVVAIAIPCGLVLAADPAELWTDVARPFVQGRSTFVPSARTRLSEGGDISTWHAQVDLFFRSGPRFIWGPGYRYEQHREPGESFRDENRFMLTGKLGWGDGSPWKGEFRALYEYRDPEDRQQTWRLRLRPGVSRSMGTGGWSWSASNEFFYDSGQDRYAQNRARLGVAKKLRETIDLTLYYMLLSVRQDTGWQETHVLGTVWTFR